MANLTQRQEKFVRALIAGKSQRQAYKEAYNAANMKDKTIDERASVLFKNDKIKTRYNELLEEHKKKALYTREKMIKNIKWIKEKAKENIKNPKKGIRQANGTIFINAIKELGELNELYPSKKQDIKMDAKINNPYADFTYEELKKNQKKIF